MNASLRIFLFGNVRLMAGGAELPEFPTRKAKALFGYLVLGVNRVFARETLAGTFWPDASAEPARRRLHTELWRIRQTLKHGNLDPDKYLISRGDGVGFNHASPYWSDVRAFDAGVRAFSAPPQLDGHALTKLAESVALYRGDLLDGVYDDWCLVRREALRAQLLSALDSLVRHHIERYDWKQALEHGQRLVGEEPLLEDAHRAVMRCHYFAGNRPAALRHYESFARFLRKELGIEPMEETRQLYVSIASGSATPKPEQGSRSSDRAPEDPNAALAEVDLALSSLRTAQRSLEHASRRLRHPRPSGAR